MTARVGNASALANGIASSSASASVSAEEELYTQLLRLQDTVLAGQHAVFKLPSPAAAQLKASLIVPDAPAAAVNGAAFATNQQQLRSPAARTNGLTLPGLGAQPAPVAHGTVSAFAAKSGGLDPIFLEKSDSLVRAEGQLKRQRIERELQTQVEQRKHAGGDPASEGLSRIDIDAVLTTALSRAPPKSGLQPAKAASVSSFDENDYYSSQAPSEWSSDADASKRSDKGAGAFTADFERLDTAAKAVSSFAESSRPAQKRALPASSSFAHSPKHPQLPTTGLKEAYNTEDDDDEYTPPDAAAFDTSRMAVALTTDGQQATDLDDDNSDYEPGEITQESTVPTPYNQPAPAAQPPPHVPVIRNHLTHLAAPQPNRVSPLATAKGPSFDLELVNGQPELVQKAQSQYRSAQKHSRNSTASPANGGTGKKNKKGQKKRKRLEEEKAARLEEKAAKRMRRQTARQAARRPDAVEDEPYIKDEPVSPPPMIASVPEAPTYGQQQQYRSAPVQVDLSSPGYGQSQYAPEPNRSGLRYEYQQPTSPAAFPVPPMAGHQPRARDTQDLRRVASMQFAHTQRAPSPPQQQHRVYSPVAPYLSRYQEAPASQEVQYVRAPSPPRLQEYQNSYSRAQSPALMPPPPAKRIIVDQYGNRYYAADSAAPASARASIAPVERYERGPSRMSYAPQAVPPRHESVYSSMAPLSQAASKRYEQPVEYIDANGYRVGREYSTRPAEPARYAPAVPTSPVYQQPRYEPMPPPPTERTSPVYRDVPRYEQMLPPAVPPPREPTSPVYQSVPRAYSVRPEEAPQPAQTYFQRPSVAPFQYARQEMPPPAAPTRAVSVMPGSGGEYPQYAQQPSYGYAPAPQAVKYVDQYGREVFPQQVRQVSEFR